jgi:hypothetical protein
MTVLGARVGEQTIVLHVALRTARTLPDANYFAKTSLATVIAAIA